MGNEELDTLETVITDKGTYKVHTDCYIAIKKELQETILKMELDLKTLMKINQKISEDIEILEKELEKVNKIKSQRKYTIKPYYKGGIHSLKNIKKYIESEVSFN